MLDIMIEIQDTIKKCADIMSKVSKMDVEVVDRNLYRVAGTGMFKPYVDQDMSGEGYNYRLTLSKGKRNIIYNPGREEVCNNCPKKNCCDEEIEISMPLILKNTVIGVIGLVGNTKEQKENVMANEKMYIELIEQIADFIIAKADEVIQNKKIQDILETFRFGINKIEQGIIITDSMYNIIAVNNTAVEQIGNIECVGYRLSLKETSDEYDDKKEYIMSINGKTIHIIGDFYNKGVSGNDSFYSILVFTSKDSFHQKMYEITRNTDKQRILGNSPQTNYLRDEISKIAKSRSTVLITGESGTGKEMVASSIWRIGDRSDKNFVAINCAAIPETLLESELFGYVKGAFTGADPKGKIGKFELANQGVIFLDEIGDMPLYLQAKLLRVLQERTISRIGSNQVIPVDVRVIAATNKDLKKMMAMNKFREDLYYRLNVIPLKIHPLRERREDIKELAYYFAHRYSELLKKDFNNISPDTMEALLNHPWYGNVRELENTIEFMMNMVDKSGILDKKTLPRDFYGEETIKTSVNKTSEEKITPLKELEKIEIQKALKIYGNDTNGKKIAAKELGIGIATLYRKLDELSK